MKNRRFLTTIFGLVSLSGLLLIPHRGEASCYSSVGGDGAVWLSGKITASGSNAQDVSVYLQAESWMSGYYYSYESACTDSSGNFYFREESSPASSCYTSYYYGTYCNWRSAECAQYCFENDTNGWYASQTFATEGYKIVAQPAWGSTLYQTYAPCEVSDLEIDFAGSQTANCALVEKDIIVRVRVQDDNGSAVSSGLTVNVSGPTYGYGTLDSSFEDIYVIPGTYYVSAYCTDYQSCLYPCITNKTIKVEEGDTLKEVQLTAKTKSATLTGVVSGSDDVLLENAYVSLGNYDYSAGSESCYAYGYDQTDSNGAYSIGVPAGNYTAWISPPWDSASGGSSYASRQESVSLSANETQEKNITLIKKGSSITGTVKDSNGTGIANAYVNIWSYENDINDWGSDQTDSSGVFSIPAVSGQKYNISAYYWDSSSNGNDSSISNCTDQGTVTVEAPAADVAFTFASWNHAVSFAFVDEAGGSLTGIYGGASIRPAGSSQDGYGCSTWVSFGNSSVSKKLAASTTYKVEPYVWGSSTYDPVSSSIEFTTGASGTSSSLQIEMIAVDATISGTYTDVESSYISVNATKGNLWRTCSVTSTGYSCAVSAGRWCLGYWLDWLSDYASMSAGSSSSCIDVVAGTSNTIDLTFLKVGLINVTVKDNAGNPVKWAWVTADPYKATDEGGDDTKRIYESNGCSTNVDGTCTIRIGASETGTLYYLTAHRPWNEMNDSGLTLPEELEVSVVAGETTTADPLIFREMDGELAVTTTVASSAAGSSSVNALALNGLVLGSKRATDAEIVSKAFVTCFSDTAGYAEATADELGAATLKCVSGDTYHCFGVNQIDNNLYISEDATAVCQVLSLGQAAVTVKMNLVDSNVPDAVTQSWDAGSANTVSLDDRSADEKDNGFKIEFPANALGDSGTTVSCTVQPDPILPYQSGGRPTCFYGYDITCKDESGSAITQLAGNATLHIPLCAAQLELLSLESSDVSFAYRDTATDSYINLTGVSIDPETGIVTGQTNHLTEFVLVGNGNLSGVDGDSETATEEAERTGETASGADSLSAGGCGCRIGGSSPASNSWMMMGLSLPLFLGWRYFLRRRTLTDKSQV